MNKLSFYLDTYLTEREPVRPGGQMHLEAAISSMSVLQSLPEDKILHQENKGGRNYVYVI